MKGITKSISNNMSRSVSLKLEENTFKVAEELIKELKISRNKYFNEAIKAYNKAKEKEHLKALMERASYAVRKDNMEILKEFEGKGIDYEAI